MYLEAHKGLNGLRVGSLAWVQFFSKLVKQAGLESSLTEPCLYSGLVGGVPVVLICYVEFCWLHQKKVHTKIFLLCLRSM